MVYDDKEATVYRPSACADCGTRGNVCHDSDGVPRCSACSFATHRARSPEPPKAVYDLPIFGWAWREDGRDLRA